jgi:hypothetical protein
MANFDPEDHDKARREFAEQLDLAVVDYLAEYPPSHNDPDSFAEAIHRRGEAVRKLEGATDHPGSPAHEQLVAAFDAANEDARRWFDAWQKSLGEALRSRPDDFKDFAELFGRTERPGQAGEPVITDNGQLTWERLVFAERAVRVARGNPILEFGGDIAEDDIKVTTGPLSEWSGDFGLEHDGELGGHRGKSMDKLPPMEL